MRQDTTEKSHIIPQKQTKTLDPLLRDKALYLSSNNSYWS